MGSKFGGIAPWAGIIVVVLVFAAAVAFALGGNSCSPQSDGSQDQAGPAAASEQASSRSAAIELPEI